MLIRASNFQPLYESHTITIIKSLEEAFITTNTFQWYLFGIA